MTILPTSLCQATLNFTGTAVPRGAAVVLWFYKTEIAGGPEVGADSIITAYEESIAGVVNANCTLTSVRMLWGVDGEALNVVVPASVGGDVVGDAMPQNVAYLARKNTAIGGRHGRGRSYWPGVPEDASTIGGRLGVTYQGYWADACDDFFAKTTANLMVMALAYRDEEDTWHHTEVTSYTGDFTLATQRRRLRA